MAQEKLLTSAGFKELEEEQNKKRRRRSMLGKRQLVFCTGGV